MHNLDNLIGMPQLDKLTFSSQVFWFFLIYFTLYFLFLRFILPTIAAALKYRSNLIVRLNQGEKKGFSDLSLEKRKNLLNTTAVVSRTYFQMLAGISFFELSKTSTKNLNSIYSNFSKLGFLSERTQLL